jgi:uncharacterized phage protein gp47/JayE
MAKTADQVVSELITLIGQNFARLVDTRVGTVLRDAILYPISSQISDLFSGLDTVAANQTIQVPDNLDDPTMDGLAANYGISRFSGSPAFGVARLFKVVLPTTTITIPSGTRVATLSTNSSDARVFKTLASVQLTPLSPADPVTGADAYVDVGVQAIVNGTTGNVDAGTITVVLDPVLGLDGVINPSATSGGKESQTNPEIAELIKARAQGRIGTRSGYRDLILANFAVDDVEVIGHDDPDSVRNQFGGEVDVIVINNSSVDAVETFAYAGPSTTLLIPTFKPLIAVSSVTGVDAFATPITLSGPVGGVGIGTDYDVVLDTTGPNAGSFIENSKIVLHPTVNVPGNSTTLTVTYQNNQQIRVIQAFLELDDNLVLGADPQAKSGIKVGINVTADIRVIPGFNIANVVSDVQTAVDDLIHSLLLGDKVDASDVIAAIQNREGVDSVSNPTFLMALASAPATPLQEIVAKKQEYLRPDTITINTV